MLAGAGGKITLSVGPDGAVMVDCGLARRSEAVRAGMKQWSQRRARLGEPLKSYANPVAIRFIVKARVHADHQGGKEENAKAGKRYTGGNVAGEIADGAEGAAI